MNKILIILLTLVTSGFGTGCKENSNQIHGSWSACSNLGYEEAHFLSDGLEFYCPSGFEEHCIRHPYLILNDSLFLELEPLSYKKFRVLKLDVDSLILQHEFENKTALIRYSRIKEKINFPGQRKMSKTEMEAYISQYQYRLKEKKCPDRGLRPIDIGKTHPILDDILEIDSVRDE